MNESRPPRRPGWALLGCAAGLAPLIAMVAAFQSGALARLGWHGGQYAYAYLGLMVATLVGGILLRAGPGGSPWRSFGLGLILAGVTGTVLVVVILVLVGIALRHFTMVG